MANEMSGQEPIPNDDKERGRFLVALNDVIGDDENGTIGLGETVSRLAITLEWEKPRVELYLRDYYDELEKKNQTAKSPEVDKGGRMWSTEEAALFDSLIGLYEIPKNVNVKSSSQDWSWVTRIAAHFQDRTPADIWHRWYLQTASQD